MQVLIAVVTVLAQGHGLGWLGMLLQIWWDIDASCRAIASAAATLV